MLNRVLLFFLAGCFPAVFFAAHNWYSFTAAQVLLLIAVPALGSLIALGLFSGIVCRLVFLFSGMDSSSAAAERLRDGFSVLTALSFCAFLLRAVLGDFQVTAAILWLSVGVVIILAVWMGYRDGARHVVMIFCLLLLTSLFQWGYGYRSSRDRLSGVPWHEVDRLENEKIRLAHRPNIYFILSESYPSRRALEEIFEIDNSSFYEQLSNQGFSLFHRAFSNYQSTLASMTAVLSMTHHYYTFSTGNLDSLRGRDIISARAYNAVVDTLERNGYRTQYVHSRHYQLRQGADLDFHWPRAPKTEALEGLLGSWSRPLLAKVGRDDPERFHAVLSRRLAVAFASSDPYFTYIYSDSPGHSDVALSRMERQDGLTQQAHYRRSYSQGIRQANRLLLGLIEEILQADPGSVIAIMGDHGAWGYRIPFTHAGEEIPAPTVALDRLGILMALRLPEDRVAEIEGETLSSVNLFRTVFAHLSSDPGILARKAPDDAYLIANGEVRRTNEAGRWLDQPVEIQWRGLYERLAAEKAQ